MNTILLETQQLRKEYKLGKELHNLVIPGIDLRIRNGEFVVIMGRSGSGKSTLLYLLGGLEETSGGEIRIGGKAYPSNAKENAVFRRDTIGMVFQQNNLIPSLTLLENIMVAALLVWKKKKEASQRSLMLMRELDIEALKHRYPSQVSGGEQQRCSIARALVNNPEILLADEPTGSLNSASTVNVLNTFSALHMNGQTIVMVTHEVESACYGKRILYLNDGRIVDEYSMITTGKKEEKEKALLEWLTNKGW